MSNVAKLFVTVSVKFSLGQVERVRLWLRAFGNNNDRRIATTVMTLAHDLREFIDVKRHFRHNDCCRTAGDASMQRNPSRITTHNFYDHHTVVTFCSRV